MDATTSARSGGASVHAGLSLLGRSAEDGQAVRVTVEGGLVTALERVTDDPGGTWISPGWMDIQINGYDGHDPNAPGAGADVTAAMVRAMWRTGVSGSCVTICTDSEPRILEGLRGIAAACESDPLVAASVVGIHVEGPHISREDGPRGAHPLRHVRPPDVAEYRRWQEAAGGRIRIITLSPEYDGAVPYIRAIVDDGVVASIGHTGATGDQIRAAVDAGARLSTHLGNGAHALIPRHPNYVQVIAHNLARWTARIGLGEGIVTMKTLRRLFGLAGRLTRSARRWRLHLPARWPWAIGFAAALAQLRAIPLFG